MEKSATAESTCQIIKSWTLMCRWGRPCNQCKQNERI